MRELKFQAWHKRKKAMFIVHDLILFDEGYGASLYRTLGKKDNMGREEEEYIRRARPSEIIIREYTCLKDKNGREIYEGDIVDAEGLILKICHCDLHARFIIGKDLLTKYYADTSIVIGSIYENPELTEAAK